MEEPRRSSRANKGQHSHRSLDELIEEERDPQTKKRAPSTSTSDSNKRLKTDDEEYGEGDVKCTPCGTDKNNYDEENDAGGMMIECESCKTWQHAKCMGYNTAKQIPNHYNCNDCQNPKAEVQNVNPVAKSTVPKATPKTIVKPKKNVVEAVKDVTRKRVAKAFYDVLKKILLQIETPLPEDFNQETTSNTWAFDLELVVFTWAGSQTNKKYIDKSRSLMVSIKKPAVIKRILEKDLSFDDLVNLSPEEIDEDLKKYADKVRQESIRRSVLTVDDSQGQRIRRTHRGEELVESSNNQSDDVNVNIMTRNIDHRRFKEDSPSEREIIKDTHTQPTYNYVQEDDDDEEQKDEHTEDIEHNKENDESESLSDDELTFILKDKKKTVSPPQQVQTPKEPVTHLPPVSSAKVWQGQLNFPEFASFGAKGEYFTCSTYKEPVDINSIIAFNRQIKICNEILAKSSYSIEGRLDRGRADAYLDKITATRDLFLVQVTPSNDNVDFDRVYGYLTDKKKVGVLSDKPGFVKDSYLLPIDGTSDNLPGYLSALSKVKGKKGLFALYVVKKDYTPSNPSILKKTPTSYTAPQVPSTDDLKSILKKLGGPSAPARVAEVPQGLPSGLTADQLSLLSGLIQQNPHVQQDPQALIQLLQQGRGYN